MKRTMDAAFLNSVANHPDVRRTEDVDFINSILNDETVRCAYAWPGVLDVGDFLDLPGTMAFKVEHGGFLFREVSPRIYDAHIMFRRPASSGHVRIATARMISKMFDEYGAEALHAGIAEGNWVTKRLVRQMRFSLLGKVVQRFNNRVCEVSHYGLTPELWRPN